MVQWIPDVRVSLLSIDGMSDTNIHNLRSSLDGAQALEYAGD